MPQRCKKYSILRVHTIMGNPVTSSEVDLQATRQQVKGYSPIHIIQLYPCMPGVG